uniref:Senescence regulator n=1 Tax=Kalanchoe fedtschenkoi TaxID=63787 RepID=A0A7N0T9F6_KALFE
MANRRNSHLARQKPQRYLSGDGDAHDAVSAPGYGYDHSAASAAAPNLFDFDESEVVWHSATDAATLSSSPGNKLVIMRSSSSSKKPSSSKWAAAAGGTSSSVPVNIPDWSKILRSDFYKQMQQSRRHVSDEECNSDDDDEEEEGHRVPPHEFLARKRVATSFSVREGAGRTLKGRDLSRVRDAIWEKIGFQD